MGAKRPLRLVVKKGINTFFKKGVFKGGGTMLPRGDHKNVPPPYKNALVRPCPLNPIFVGYRKTISILTVSSCWRTRDPKL